MNLCSETDSETNSKDQSCGISISEFTSQTVQIAKAEKSSETKIHLKDVGLDANECSNTPLTASSQIPRYEMHSKITGTDYSDKAINAILLTDSKYSEVKLSEDSFSDSNLENIRKVIRQEFSKLQHSVHKVQCSECKSPVIYGVRYKCNVCEDFNMCSDCEEVREHSHLLLKIKNGECFEERTKKNKKNRVNELCIEKLAHVSVVSRIKQTS